MDLPQFHIIAHIENDFTAKFAIPRQSGLVVLLGILSKSDLEMMPKGEKIAKILHIR